MQAPRMNKSVQRVTLLQRDSSGGVVPVTLFEKKSKKKKSTMETRIPERLVRQAARAQAVFATTFLRKHDESARDRKNGWIRDLPGNLIDSASEARKEYNLDRLMD